MSVYPYPEFSTEAFDFDHIAVSSVAIGLTAAKLNPNNAIPANKVTFSVETNNIRYRYDGGVPTAALGHLVTAGSPPVQVVGEGNIAKLQFVRVAADADVFVTYER